MSNITCLNSQRKGCFDLDEQMLRVLKLGGKLLLYDMFPMVNQAASLIVEQGLQQVQALGGMVMKVISAEK